MSRIIAAGFIFYCSSANGFVSCFVSCSAENINVLQENHVITGEIKSTSNYNKMGIIQINVLISQKNRIAF